MSHLFSLRRPKPVCFPWASSTLFLTLHYHGLYWILWASPTQLHYSSSLGSMGLLSTLYFLYFHYFGPTVAHSHFSTSYTAHGLLFLSFRAPLSPFTSSRFILFILWACDPLFLPFGLNGLSIRLPTLFCPCCWASPFYLGFRNGHQHLVPWTYETFLQFICE